MDMGKKYLMLTHQLCTLLFVAIPVLTLAIARSRARRTSALIQFPAEAASASTHELAERHLDTYSRHFDLVSQAS